MGKARHAGKPGDPRIPTYTYQDVIRVSEEPASTEINIRDRWNTILCEAIAAEKDQRERAWLRGLMI